MRKSVVALALLGAAPSPPQTVFGIVLGQTLDLPECPKEQYGYAIIVQQKCWKDASTYAGYDQASKAIAFPLNALPTGSSNGTVEAMLSGEKVIGVSFFTDGISSQSYVIDMLSKKYGKPDSQSSETVSNMAGATFNSVTAVWAKDGLTISFMGTLGRLDTGEVMIDTPEAAARRQAARAKSASQKTPL